ncbi:MAG: sigma-70 family RNA polymerase sigma factor [Ignavibacteriae bacterium]|nr:sigma-70 family RNA polymerase sigma factor [Ignavibacteriota bacterium]
MRPPLVFLNSDARILEGIRSGDESALEALYAANRRTITALVMRNNGSQDDAADVLQDALVILWERVRAGRYEHTAAIGTFLFATARNLWLRRLARARRESPADIREFDVPHDDPSPQEALEEEEDLTIVHAALDALGDPCRALLVLFYWEDASMEEVARTLGFANAATAKSKKYQCKEQLKRLMRSTRDGHEQR